MSRDGARVAFKALEAIAKVEHIAGRGWYGLRRQAADMAETATTDDRVKDRLGGWQDSETRKSIYQDRETDALRTEAANVRRQLRLGHDKHRASDSGLTSTEQSNHKPEDSLNAIWESLTHGQRTALRRRLLSGNDASPRPVIAPDERSQKA